ncbi:MAG: wax ester/triacylglycerol synthase family O-acyltransferase [Candidatus Promineifilaceae bacterium]
MQELSGLDSSFLYMETPTTPMHVGSVAVFEGSLSFDDFRALISSRIHLLPRMRQRLLTVPLSIDRPYWADDPDFNLDMHLQHVRLPKPSNWSELRKLASRIFSEPLDRSRPLWDLTFVEGLDAIPQVPPGSVAFISKVHHAAIDGVSGNDMLTVLLDTSPKGRNIPMAEPFDPDPIPSEVGIISRSAFNFMTRPLKLPNLLYDATMATIKTGVLTRVQGLELPPVPFTAPHTRLNGAISSQRIWNTALLSLDRVKQLKSTMGTTLNDVVLAICAGALRRYLADKDELPNKSLVAMVPVSTRSKSEAGTMGNQVSAMTIQLSTQIADPIERLEAIHKHTSEGKMYQGAIGAKTLGNVLEFVPFGLAGQAARLYTRLNVAERINPPINLTITNVPGPQLDMYLAGHKMLSVMGMAPIIDGMGLLITVLSYNGVISMSPTSSPKVMPDLDLFARYLREEANALEAAIQEAFPAPKADEPVPEMQSTPFFVHLGKALKTDPSLAPEGSGVFVFRVSGATPKRWVINLNNSPGTVAEDNSDTADKELGDATFAIRDDHLMKVLAGELGMQIAFMQGKLKVKGDVGKALKLAPLLQQVPLP